ncbi:NUDIX domain-containing protein [Bacillus sp. 31A1R]|uniref:NUDIX domain-containing protein n=1 Tax=Robertmurraya mangrovi TaxID=3098077 RepID=A0ABU5J2U8_9BACI|nr:NUDIX domain-containing protein [Bacillus sp. 31A1R]MDZ5473724.1 NUDIX domain-containing protein [Bacillus sp. 31A1R]
MFIVNVEGAIYKEDKWLVIRRSTMEEHGAGELSLVGGKVDVGDPTFYILEETIKREVFEEVGIQIADELQVVFNSMFTADDGVNVVNIVMLGEHREGEAYPKSSDEVDAVFWLTEEDILNNKEASPWLKESIKKAVEAIRKQRLEV